ncbi:MAG: methyltransferase domain-containing protein, partial [Gammaproteobacteria bacterium]
HPVKDANSLAQLEQWKKQQRKKQPLIADNSIDLVISNCVLNLVGDDQKRQLTEEIFRVLKPGGWLAISDIVSDEPIPQHLKDDETLWSGCISGAFLEEEILQRFAEAGFLAVKIDKWATEPWQIVEDIEFRSITVTAIKGEGSECIDKGHAVIYRGPHANVRDDEGHEFPRGERMAVCERTFRFLTEGPLGEDFIGIAPAQEHKSVPWCAPSGSRRPASETKRGVHIHRTSGSCC